MIHLPASPECLQLKMSSQNTFLASRVMTLEKKPSIRQVGVGETIRRIAGKFISMILKTDITDASAPLQICGGLEGGVEASVHAVRQM